MGASDGPDVKRRGRTCWSPQTSGELMTALSVVVMVLHLSLLSSAQLIPPGSGQVIPLTGTNSSYDGMVLYWASEVEALQALWGAWNTSTPDISTYLPGWNSIQPFPCARDYLGYHLNSSWQGVNCIKTYNSTQYLESIFSISITSTSIVGILPPDFGNFTDLRFLQVTGNPNLTGLLPVDGFQNLYILDLHDNGFSGPVPIDVEFSNNLLHLDLSGNQFTGEYPFHALGTALQVLSIGRNNLEGEIPVDSFWRMTVLGTLDLSHNKFNGSLPDITANKNLKSLDVSENQFDGPLPDLTQNPRLTTANLGRNELTLPTNATSLLDVLCNMNATTLLTTLNLSYNQLKGPLSHWISSTSCLGSLQALYLDGNTLSGTLNISKMRAWGLLRERFINTDGSAENAPGGLLSVMSLRNNNISQVISDADTIANTTNSFMLQGNAYCDKYDPTNDALRCYCTQICYVTPASLQSDRRKIAIIASVCSTAAVVLILVVVVAASLYKTKRYKQYPQVQFEKRFEEFDVKPTIFGYNELRAATRDFHEDMKLGQGSYGAVYKGVLANGNVVAVKQLFTKSVQSIGMDEFLNEVVLITGMKHRNLVNLKGCCLRDSQRLLVYEYIDNSDVDRVLLGAKRPEVAVIGWAARRRMCEGVARGLHYLHALGQPRVIHRDIKAGNVLLDSQLQPKIADFGLALLFPDDATHIHTVHVAGTKGYLAPEYAVWGQVSDKVGVYSFGVLCLEIISGRRNIDTTLPLDRMYLSQWAWQLHEEGRLVELADPGLGQLSEAEAGEVERVLRMCLLCLQTAAERRPSMASVLHLLESHNQPDVQAALQNIVDKDEGPSSKLTMVSEISVIDKSSAGRELSIMEEGNMASDGGCGGSRSLLAEDYLSKSAYM